MKVAVLFPELLGTYGDGGNGLVLRERARRRGIGVELVHATLDDDVPSADLYLLGGGEDGPQRLAADLLQRASFRERVADGARVLAVCAGLQILGRSFSIEGDDTYGGLALVDVTTHRGGQRSVGELAVRVGNQVLVGFENHGGVTSLHSDVAPLGSVVSGKGNDGAYDGFVTESIWATYAHGPVLALNPWFADLILAAVLGEQLEPLVTVADDLYKERCAALGF